jgi:biopolymer transport protein ExbD
MIDMTFQLITFFMVVISFEQTQADERIKLPADQLAIPPEVARENEIVLNIGYPRDQSGNETGEPGVTYGDAYVPVLNYGPNLQQERAKYIALHGSVEALSEVTIVLRADSEVPTGLIQELMKMAQEAGFTKFSFKAKQERPD